jgi:hypothetical protein
MINLWIGAVFGTIFGVLLMIGTAPKVTGPIPAASGVEGVTQDTSGKLHESSETVARETGNGAVVPADQDQIIRFNINRHTASDQTFPTTVAPILIVGGLTTDGVGHTLLVDDYGRVICSPDQK